MKTPLLLVIALSAFFCGCDQSPQEKAYYDALKAERPVAMDITSAAPMLIANYTKVIEMDPTTKWAKQSQTRIEILKGIMQDDQKKHSGSP